MIRVCAWHPQRTGKLLFLGQKEPFIDHRVTHGICEDCKFALETKTLIDQKKEKFDQEWEKFNKIRSA